MKLPLDENLNPVPVVSFEATIDLTDDKYIPKSTVVRLKAITESRVWCYGSSGEAIGPGVLFSENETEYVKVPAGYCLWIQGTANITEVY